MTSPLCFQAHALYNVMKQALTVTYSQDKQVCHSHLNSNHSVVCVCVSSFPRSLTQLRMDRENAEARVREMEDQLAELQDELRRETGNKMVSQKHTLVHPHRKTGRNSLTPTV